MKLVVIRTITSDAGQFEEGEELTADPPKGYTKERWVRTVKSWMTQKPPLVAEVGSENDVGHWNADQIGVKSSLPLDPLATSDDPADIEAQASAEREKLERERLHESDQSLGVDLAKIDNGTVAGKNTDPTNPNLNLLPNQQAADAPKSVQEMHVQDQTSAPVNVDDPANVTPKKASIVRS